MSKYNEDFNVNLSVEELMVVCKEVVANLGWAVLGQSQNTIKCKETGKFDINKANFFAEVEIILSANAGNTKISLNGSVFGMGPFASKHILGEVKKLRNMIDVEANQFKNKLNKQPNIANISVASELEKFASLHSQGVLSDDEFKAAKNKLLGI
jgi:hypothetical protein